MKQPKQSFIENVKDLTDYLWEDECRDYEETYDVEIGEDTEPTEDHIFTTAHRVEKFLERKVWVYGREIPIGNIMKALTDDELHEILENVSEQLAQEGRL